MDMLIRMGTPALTQAEIDVITAVGCDQRQFLIGHDWEVAKLKRDGFPTGKGTIQLTVTGRAVLDGSASRRRL